MLGKHSVGPHGAALPLGVWRLGLGRGGWCQGHGSEGHAEQEDEMSAPYDPYGGMGVEVELGSGGRKRGEGRTQETAVASHDPLQ